MGRRLRSPAPDSGHYDVASMVAAGVRQQSTPSSPPPNSTTSIHRLGSPTCWPACRIIPPGASTNSCRGTGVLRASLTPPERTRLSAQSDLTRGRRRMRTEILQPSGYGRGARSRGRVCSLPVPARKAVERYELRPCVSRGRSRPSACVSLRLSVHPGMQGVQDSTETAMLELAKDAVRYAKLFTIFR